MPKHFALERHDVLLAVPDVGVAPDADDLVIGATADVVGGRVQVPGEPQLGPRTKSAGPDHLEVGFACFGKETIQRNWRWHPDLGSN